MLVCFDGSPSANDAIDVAAVLLPGCQVWIAVLWVPPFVSSALRKRLWQETRSLDRLVQRVEEEGGREAERLAERGLVLARALDLDGTTVVRSSFAGEGLGLARLAAALSADVVVVGSRGLGGSRAVLGSVSDALVHHSPQPVLVVPHPLLSSEREDAVAGPVLVGWDGSATAAHALRTAVRLFPGRRFLLLTVREEEEAPEVEPPAADVFMAGSHVAFVHVPLPGSTRVHGRAVAGLLVACAQENRAAIVVVGSHGRAGLGELLGSVAAATVRRAYRAVLIVRDPGTDGGVGVDPVEDQQPDGQA